MGFSAEQHCKYFTTPAELPFPSLQFSYDSTTRVPVTGRRQQHSCIMGSVIVNGEEDVVHACAINREDVQSWLADREDENNPRGQSR